MEFYHGSCLAGGGDNLSAAIVEVDRSAKDCLSVDMLTEIFMLAEMPLSKHEIISIHRRLCKVSCSHAITSKALLTLLGL